MPSSILSEIQTPSEIVYRWASREDIPSIAKVLHANLLDFELHDHFAPDRKARSDEFYVFVLNRVRKFFVQPNCRYMVAERTNLNISGLPQTGESVGFSAWEAHGDDNTIATEWSRTKSGWLSALESRLVQVELFYNQNFQGNVINYGDFIRTIDLLHASYETLDSLRSNMHLQFLMVAPAWQKGHGIGRRLLQWGLDVAKQLRLPVVLESSLAGYEFYLKHGFRLLTTVRIDTKPEKAYDMPIVVYDTQSSAAS
jgi:ribosomal protein S18 acetylase RimI-like enzyme